MTRISTGTVSISNGETIFTLWDGDDDVVLSEITAPAQSPVVIEGVANFIKTRLSTTSAELVLPHSGAGGASLACAISAMTPAETQIGTLNARTARVIQELATVDANGRGLFFRFSDTTTDADAGAGYIRLNNADPTLATAAYIDVLDANGATVSGEIDTWDDSTSLGKGNLWVRSIADPTAFRAYAVTGSVVDGTGYRKLSLTHIGGSGSFAADDELMVAFARTGDIGEGYVTDATVADLSELTALEGEVAGYLVFVTDLQTDFGAYSGRSGVVRLIAGPDWELVALYTGPKGNTGDQGEKGWSPQLVIVSDGARRVFQLVGYVGGVGTAPTANVGDYLKSDGTFTATIGDAVDVRGPAGLDGAGTVASVESGAGTSIDDTDPTAPIVNVLAFTGDSGSGGALGGVPAPSAGDAAAGKLLGAGGAWVDPPETSIEADQWRLSSNATSDGVISSGFERVDTDSPGKIGAGLSLSSGVFEFPSAGLWMVQANFSFENSSAEDRSVTGVIEVTTNNGSSWSNAARGKGSLLNSGAYKQSSGVATHLFYVADTSTHKVRFSFTRLHASSVLSGPTDQSDTTFTFIRFGTPTV